MPSFFRKALTQIGARFPQKLLLRGRGKTILMYHGVSRKADPNGLDVTHFEQHIEMLTRNFEVVRASDEDRRNAKGRLCVALTFDDGLRNNAEIAVPILRKYRVPATFFICDRNTRLQKPLWFTYLKMLERYFPGDELRLGSHCLDMSAGARRLTVAELEKFLLSLRPHPSAMYAVIENELPPLNSFIEEKTLIDEAYGMTDDQIRELAADPLFEIGAHTMDHPMLPMCDEADMTRQVAVNQTLLMELCKRPIQSIAYPNGDYTPQVLEVCAALGFRNGYSVTRQLRLDGSLEARRAGIYYPSLSELGCKIRLSAVSRRAGVRRLTTLLSRANS